MTAQPNSNPSAQPRTPRQNAYARQLLLNDIRLTWGKFTDQELTELDDTDALVTQLAERYGLPRHIAQPDADALLQGRSL